MSSNIIKLATVCAHIWQEREKENKTGDIVDLSQSPLSTPFPSSTNTEDLHQRVELHIGWCPTCFEDCSTVKDRRRVSLHPYSMIRNYWAYRAALPGQPKPLPRAKNFQALSGSPCGTKQRENDHQWSESSEERCLSLVISSLGATSVSIEGEDWPVAKTESEICELLLCARSLTVARATQGDGEDCWKWVPTCAEVREEKSPSQAIAPGGQAKDDSGADADATDMEEVIFLLSVF